MLTRMPTYAALKTHWEEIQGIHLNEFFATEGRQRVERFSLTAAGIFLDYSKNRINTQTLELLLRLAEQDCQLKQETQAMLEGKAINRTEKRAVLHTALRNSGTHSVFVDGQDIVPEVQKVLAQMKIFSDRLHNGDWKGFDGQAITDVVNIGIGGSDLGPHMVTEALRPYHKHLRVHFVSNVDATHLLQVLDQCQAATTLFLVASKSFTTQETMTNAHTARQWLLDKTANDTTAIAKHFVAISTNTAAVEAFGIAPQNMFRFWDWVGGRFSLWSAIGLSICCAIGYEGFQELLAGAEAMDQHFKTAPLSENMPVILALLGVWYNNFFGAHTHAVLPYDQRLHLFPAYLQQTDMESNGKRTTRDGRTVDYPTGPVVWGQAGTNGQHAFYQLIHQGTQLIPCDFILTFRPWHGHTVHHQILLSHGLAQSEALMNGKAAEEVGLDDPNVVHRVFPGNIPSNTLLLPELSPRYLGSLVALYEHKIFVQGILWNIFSFDQWGVELGKELAQKLLQEMQQDTLPSHGHDASTLELLRRVREGMGG
ncbi:MAG: glucose-6-phosphate isomerase [Bernardetiaceae bacterium]